MVAQFVIENSKQVRIQLAPHLKLLGTMALNSDETVEYMAQVPHMNALRSLTAQYSSSREHG